MGPSIPIAREPPSWSWVRQSVLLPIHAFLECLHLSPVRRGTLCTFEMNQEDAEAQSPSVNLAGKPTGATVDDLGAGTQVGCRSHKCAVLRDIYQVCGCRVTGTIYPRLAIGDHSMGSSSATCRRGDLGCLGPATPYTVNVQRSRSKARATGFRESPRR